MNDTVTVQPSVQLPRLTILGALLRAALVLAVYVAAKVWA